MSVLVIGSIALDTVETPFGKIKDALGGSATYFSTCASFFTKVNLVSCVGTDFPKRYIEFFKKKGVDLKGLQIKKGKTFRWKGRYDYDFNTAHTISTELNLLSDFMPHIPYEYRNVKFVFLANIDPKLQKLVLSQIKRPKFIACDSMNYWIESKKDDLLSLLKRIDLFIVNDAELRQLTNCSNLLKAARRLLKKGPRMLIVKKGEHGAVFFSKNMHFCAPAYLNETICDPTGAGDSFAGGFMGYLASCNRISQQAIRKAIIYGSLLASYNVESFSIDRLKKLTKRDIIARYNAFRHLTRF